MSHVAMKLVEEVKPILPDKVYCWLKKKLVSTSIRTRTELVGNSHDYTIFFGQPWIMRAYLKFSVGVLIILEISVYYETESESQSINVHFDPKNMGTHVERILSVLDDAVLEGNGIFVKDLPILLEEKYARAANN